MARLHVTASAGAARAARWTAAAVTLVVGLTLAASAEARGPASLAGVAKGLLNAVVNISTSQTVSGSRGVPGDRETVPFGDFFDEFLDRRNRGRSAPRRVESLGSGFVIDPAGLIVTNYHVIEGADEINTIFTDGSQLTASVVGHDPETDLALLRVNPSKPLTSVHFGRSDDLQIGDWVMAVGNPFGLGGTVTIGILSARNRDIDSGPFDDYLQTDAAVNRGNSGGPLFNMDGEVVGVNTAIISPNGGSIGISFAVPSEIVSAVVDQLKQYGHARRGWLGVKIQEVDADIAEALGLEGATGAMVTSVTEDSPAAAAGILTGDVVLSFNGRAVAEMRQLPRLVAETPVGDSVTLEVLRDGSRKTFDVVIGQLDENDVVPVSAVVDKGKEESAHSLGLSLAIITGSLRRQFSLADDAEGVVVTDVQNPSAASEKGVKPGDVILEVGEEKVTTPQEVESRIAEMKSEGRRRALILLDQGNGELHFIAVTIE